MQLDVCCLCGSSDHNLSNCPWKKNAMKKTLIALAVILLTGCAGLSINFDVAASYRSDVPLGQRGAK